jgi:hypothetical protein
VSEPRRWRPRDYLEDERTFGRDPDALWKVPRPSSRGHSGDFDLEVMSAMHQHLFACAVRERQQRLGPLTDADLASTVKLSRSTLNKVLNGTIWADGDHLWRIQAGLRSAGVGSVGKRDLSAVLPPDGVLHTVHAAHVDRLLAGGQTTRAKRWRRLGAEYLLVAGLPKRPPAMGVFPDPGPRKPLD